jgi:hypothetical protein
VRRRTRRFFVSLMVDSLGGRQRKRVENECQLSANGYYGIVILYPIAHTSLTTSAFGIGLVVVGFEPASLHPTTTPYPVPRGTGFFVPGDKAKQQNLLSYILSEADRMVSAKASQMAARPAHPRNTTGRPPCCGAQLYFPMLNSPYF